MAEEVKTENTNVSEEAAPEERVYSSEEVAKMIEEGKKQAREEAKRNANKEFQRRLDETKKLSKMSDQERLEYELAQREKILDEREREISLLEQKNEATKILNERGLSLSLVDFVVKETAEDTLAAINLLDKEFKKCVKAEVEKRLAGSTPKKGLPVDKAITKEDFLKMSYSELVELKQNNPDLFLELSK
jgi:hypothetical protein